MLEFVSAFDEFVYFLVLCVYLFFEFALCFDEVLVGGCEVVASCACPCDGAAYCYAGESDDGCDEFSHVTKFIVGCFGMLML